MSLITHVRKSQNASLTYFKGLLHAGDARLCIENENWVPAAVSLYYAVFDLTVAALLASEYDPEVDHEGVRLPLGEAMNQGADLYHYIQHSDALRVARQQMQEEFAEALTRLRELRLYASYYPRMNLQRNGRLRVDTCTMDAATFVRRVQQEAGELENRFRLFRNRLREHGHANPDHQAYLIADADIEQHPEEPIRELGHYHNERAVALAREIHAAVYPAVQRC